MPITPEQAQAELARRELARRELARRELAKRGAGKTDPVSLPSFMDSPGLAPVKRALDIQQEEAQSGREKIKKAFHQTSLTDLITDEKPQGPLKRGMNLGLGALQYLTSPFTGVAQGIVGEPIAEVAKAIGVPDKGAEFIGKLGENAAYFASPGAAIKSAMAMKASPGLTAGRKATQATVEYLNKAKPNFTIKKAEEAVGVAEEAAPKGNPASSILMQPQLKEAVVKDVVDATKASIDTLQFDKSKRLFRNISDFLKTGEVQVQDLPGILKAENITPEEFANIWTDTISLAGRELNHLSRLSKDIGFVSRTTRGRQMPSPAPTRSTRKGNICGRRSGTGSPASKTSGAACSLPSLPRPCGTSLPRQAGSSLLSSTMRSRPLSDRA